MGMSASMQKIRSWSSNLFTWASLPIIGFGIGWLLGLSVSPVVSIVITSVAGVAAAVITVLSGLEGKLTGLIASSEQQISIPSKINPRPLAALIIGLFLGSIVGIQVRTHNLLGIDTGLSEQEIARRLFENEHPYTPYAKDFGWMKVDASLGITTALAAEVDMWTDLGLGKEEAARRLFEIKYPSSSKLPMTTMVTGTNNAWLHTGLFTLDNPAGQTECDRLSGVPTNKLHEEMNDSQFKVLNTLPDVIESPETLREVVDILCEPT